MHTNRPKPRSWPFWTPQCTDRILTLAPLHMQWASWILSLALPDILAKPLFLNLEGLYKQKLKTDYFLKFKNKDAETLVIQSLSSFNYYSQRLVGFVWVLFISSLSFSFVQCLVNRHLKKLVMASMSKVELASQPRKLLCGGTSTESKCYIVFVFSWQPIHLHKFLC